MGWEAKIRIGTADRERAITALSDHLAEGRLEIAEYEHRCTAVTSARTRADLLLLFDDLPAPHPGFGESKPPKSPVVPREQGLVERSRRQRSTNILLLGFVLTAVAAVVVVTAITGGWWALAPALLIGLVLLLMS
ncbi:MAG: DUF1707 domain-containing protein [Actinomycetota bacterium]|nr:DUF1707 domain-containing protein [Actinomycetota bacterium]